ncbi:phage tail protein [Salmonella enterica]|nr:phage tail protein [Salmonella enterica]EHH5781158.1 phage tail protein [Salmonella enterica]ELE3234336.1 phage tail protein [Salmonella enterica subsp. enterica serovar Pomona]
MATSSTTAAAQRNAPALQNSIVLTIGGQSFTGWESASINRSIENVAGQFTLGVAKRIGVSVKTLRPGQSLTLTINNQTVVTGWLDEFGADVSDTAFSLSVNGRDKTGDLVDCAAVYQGGMWSGRTLAQIAADLCQPFGITVRWLVTDATASKAFSSFKLEHGETVYEALGRAARMRGVLMTSNAAGDLVFTQAGTAHAGSLELGKNMLSVNHSDSWHDRFSLYRVVGGHACGGSVGDSITDVAQITGPSAEVSDPEVTRYRPTLKIADHNVTQQTAWARADHERRHAIAKSRRFTVTVPGWYRDDGALWDVNFIVLVTAAELDINAEPLLIAGVEYQLGDDGLQTQLTLAPREGYEVPVESENKGSGSYTAAEAGIVG